MTDAKAPTDNPTHAVPNTDEDVTISLYRAAIGPVSTDYYLPIFSRFETAERAGLSWNTAASLLTFNWLIYRQLWGAALGYAGIIAAVVLLVFGIGRLVFQMSDTLTMALSLGLGLAAFVLPGLFGNVLFHKDCRKRMAAALTAHAVLADACMALQRQSSSRMRALWVSLANGAVLGIAVFAYFQISALSTLSVLPQGALDAGHVETGLGTQTSAPLAGSSAAGLVASEVSDPQPAASAPMPAPSDVAAATTAPVIPVAAESAPLVGASAPVMAASEPTATPDPFEPVLPTQPKSKPKATPAKSAKVPTAVNQPQTKASVEKTPVARAPAATPEALFYINVGLFSKPQNAARVHAQLLEAKLPSVMKELKTTKARQIRVRVGPFATEAQAEAAAEKIKAMKFDAGIIQQ